MKSTRRPRPWRRKLRVTAEAARYLKRHPGPPIVSRLPPSPVHESPPMWAHVRWEPIDGDAMNGWLTGVRNQPPMTGELRVEKVGKDWFWTCGTVGPATAESEG